MPLVEMRDIRVAFGGLRAVDGVSVNLYPGEVVALLGDQWSGIYEHDRDRVPVADKWARWFPGREIPFAEFEPTTATYRRRAVGAQ